MRMQNPQKKNPCIHLSVLAARVVLVLALGACAPASALTLTWCGGTTGNFEDAANWSGGEEGHLVPQNYDELVFPTGGTFTHNSAYLVLNGLTFTSSDPVTLTGTPLDLESGRGLTCSGNGEVTIENTLCFGYNSASSSAIAIAAGATVHFRGRMTGKGILIFDDLGTVHIYGDNDYTGKTRLLRGQIHLHSNTALGAGGDDLASGTELNVTATATTLEDLKVYFHGITTDEYFEMYTHTRINNKIAEPVVFPADTVTTFNGTVDHKTATVYKLESGAKVVHNGLTVFQNPSFSFRAPSEIVFNGAGSTLWYDYMNGTGLVRIQQPIRLSSRVTVPQTSANWLRVYGASPSRRLECADALYVDGVVGYPQWQGNGQLDVCGNDQTFLMLDAGESYPRATLQTPDDQPAMVRLLLMTGLKDITRADFYGQVKGPLALVCAGPLPMAFHGVSTTTGDLTLENGANVMFSGSATWGGKTVTVTGGATLTLDSAAFPTDATLALVDATDESAAASRIVLGANMSVASVTINGEAVATGQTIGASGSGANIIDDVHFGGSGVIAVGAAELEVSVATWTGAGADTLFSTVDNWDCAPQLPNLLNGLVAATFASGGTDAQLGETARLKGVRFTGGDFTVSATAPAALILGSGGIAAAADAEGAARTYTLDAPLTVDGALLSVAVDGPATTLRLTQPVTASDPDGSVAFKKSGTGTLYTDGANNMPGARSQQDGVWYATGASLGPAGTTVTIRQATSSVAFYLNGGTFEQTFDILRTESPAFIFGAAPHAENLLTQHFVFNDWYGIEFQFGAASTTRFLGGFTKYGSWAGTFTLGGGATVAFEQKPFVYHETAQIARFVNDSVTRASVTFAASGGYALKGFAFGGAVDVHFTADDAVRLGDATRTADYNCILTLMRRFEAYPKLYLHGTRQYFDDVATAEIPGGMGRFVHDTTGVEIDGTDGAELHIAQRQIDGVWNVVFTGAAALVKEGEKTLTLGGATTSCGQLEVAGGKLAFASDAPEAGWPNTTAVVLSGGTLAVDRSTRIGPQAKYTFSGGTLELAAGVTLRGKSATFVEAGGSTTHRSTGILTAATHPDFISGEGRLILANGMVISLR